MGRFNGLDITYSPTFWWIVLITSCFAAGAVAWANISWILVNWVDIIKNLLVISGLVITLSSKLQPFYLFLARVKAVLLNIPVSCNLNTDYTLSSNGQPSIPKFKETLIHLGNSKTVLRERSNELVIKVDGIDFYVRSEITSNTELAGSEIIENVNIQVLDYHAPYSLTIDVLRSKLLPFLEEIESDLNPTNCSYLFEATFTKNHPFLGLFAQRIPFDDLKAFDMEYTAKENITCKKSIVKITKRGISVQTNRLTSLYNLVYKHLAVSGG